MNFKFDGNMSRDVLESYLSRAVTASGLYESDTLDDDLRVIARMGVKFIGRASGIWYMLDVYKRQVHTRGRVRRRHVHPKEHRRCA